jgi:hypothetical protein
LEGELNTIEEEEVGELGRRIDWEGSSEEAPLFEESTPVTPSS